jgi:hypothetical protein
MDFQSGSPEISQTMTMYEVTLSHKTGIFRESCARRSRRSMPTSGCEIDRDVRNRILFEFHDCVGLECYRGFEVQPLPLILRNPRLSSGSSDLGIEMLCTAKRRRCKDSTRRPTRPVCRGNSADSTPITKIADNSKFVS